MILGVGVDIIEIDRIEEATKKQKNFLNKIFTQNELEYFKQRSMNSEVIAGNFAAKEAISKTLGTGMRKISFGDIEILRDKLGKPTVTLNNNLKNSIESIFECGQAYKIHVSISHSKNNAIAYAILECLD
ncbi:MAG: holo-ACP synthase [Clostridium perfringens]|nr:holo-ACP synthase [Clostridium perfringens]